MALVSCGLLYYPTRTFQAGSFNSNMAGAGIGYDSDTDVITYIGMMPFDDTIEVVRWRTATVTTGATLDVAVESLTNGRPSGSLIAAGATASVVVADGDDSTVKTATMGTPPSLNAGDKFAITWRVDTTGPTPAGNLFTRTTVETSWGGQLPLPLQDAGAGTWAAITGGQLLAQIELGTVGVWPFPGLFASAAQDAVITSFNSGTGSNNERGSKLVVPMACEVIGVSVYLGNVAAGGDFTLSLWPSSSTTDGDALGQGAWDGDTLSSTTQDGWVDVYFDPVTLAAGDTVYIAVRPDTTNNVAVFHYTAINSTTLGFPGPATYHNATRLWTAGSAAAWTLNTNIIQPCALILSKLDDGTGGGGSGGGLRMAGHGGLAA